MYLSIYFCSYIVRSAAEEAEEEDTLGVPLISFPLFLFGI